MFTTLNLIRAGAPCAPRWETLLAALSKTESDDEPLALRRILETNGLEDAIWALRACAAAQPLIGEFAQRCANRAKEYAARYAADAARYAAARYAAAADDAAARYAADAAARYAAATAAARYAADTADAAARYAAEHEKQKQDFIELFG